MQDDIKTFQADWLAVESVHFYFDENGTDSPFFKLVGFDYPDERSEDEVATISVPTEHVRRLLRLVGEAAIDEKHILANTDDQSEREDIEDVISNLHTLYNEIAAELYAR